MTNFTTPPEMEDLAEQIGTFMEYWGFKKVHGQIWCHLFLSREPLDAADLMARLAISKALVSISLKELQEYNVIEEAGKGPRGTKTYSAKQDLITPIVETIRRRERRMIARIQTAHSLLSGLPENEKARTELDWQRVTYMGHLIQFVQGGIEQLVKKKWGSLGDIFFMRARAKGFFTNPPNSDAPPY